MHAGSRPLPWTLGLSLVVGLSVSGPGCGDAVREGVLPHRATAVPVEEPPPSPLSPDQIPADGTLRFGLIPGSNEAVAEDYTPLLDHLSQVLEVPVGLVTAASYKDMIEVVSGGTTDLALLPPLVYVLSHRPNPAVRSVVQVLGRGTTTYSSFIAVRADSPYYTIQDLDRHHVTFVDPYSASGFLFAYAAFLRVGMDPALWPGGLRFAGTHPAAVEALLEGRTDAVATWSGMLREAAEKRREGGLPEVPVRILTKTGRIPRDTICAGPAVTEGAVARVRAALVPFDAHGAVGGQLFHLTGYVTGWQASNDATFDSLRAVLANVESHWGRPLDLDVPPVSGAVEPPP